jgi:general transcription factor 3C polypeptide 3 (transcription factor C subunit 4)
LNRSGEGRIFDYPDLFREVADQLRQAGLYQQALTFYQPLQQVPEQALASLHLQMGKCYLGGKLNRQAEECFQTAIQIDENNIDARIQLAKMYEALNEQQQAFIFVNEILSLRKTQDPRAPQERPKVGGSQMKENSFMPTKSEQRSYYKPRRLVDSTERQNEEAARAKRLQEQYAIMRMEHGGMRDGHDGSTRAWMEAARDLIDDFRGFKTFYPWDKYAHFLGYTGNARLQAETPLDKDLVAMANRLSQSI